MARCRPIGSKPAFGQPGGRDPSGDSGLRGDRAADRRRGASPEQPASRRRVSSRRRSGSIAERSRRRTGAWRRTASSRAGSAAARSSSAPASGPRSPFESGSCLARAAAVPEETPIAITPPLVADFSRLTPDERFFPLEEFTRTVSDAWSRRRDLWQYAPPLGLPELREEIARRLSEQRRRALRRRDPGHQRRAAGPGSALSDVHRSGRSRRGRVADVLRRARARAVGGASRSCRCRCGPTAPDPRPLLGRRVKLVYLMPERQNPTGVTTLRRAPGGASRGGDRGRARSSSRTATRSRSRASRRCRARRRTASSGSGRCRRTSCPGFRIGWIAGPAAIIDRLARVKRTADFQTPVPIQAAVAAFLRAGADRKARQRRA